MQCVYRDSNRNPCWLSSRTRGLCHGHYQTMRSYVRNGEAGEADLVRRKLLMPKGSGGSPILTGHSSFKKGSIAIGSA